MNTKTRPSSLKKLVMWYKVKQLFSIGLNKSQISGHVFKDLGFESSRTRNGRFWLVVERTGDEMNNLLPESGVLNNG